MGQRAPYIPRADEAFRDWLNNFAKVLADSPWSFGQPPPPEMEPPEIAAMLVDLAQRYEDAYVLAKSPGTHSQVTVAAKNKIRREAWQTVRPLSMLIKHHMGISDGQKIKLGIIPHHVNQSPIPQPANAPALSIDYATPGLHRLRYYDPASPSRRAKPYGVVQMQLAIDIKERLRLQPKNKTEMRLITHHVFDVKHKSKDSGKMAVYKARWITQRCLTGPWSMPISMVIAFAGSSGDEMSRDETNEISHTPPLSLAA